MTLDTKILEFGPFWASTFHEKNKVEEFSKTVVAKKKDKTNVKIRYETTNSLQDYGQL